MQNSAADPAGVVDAAKPVVASEVNRLIDSALARRRDMSWHDYLIDLLHLGSALEHALLVQYLYAAYTLGGQQVPADRRDMVRGWQETLLSVAREEMGHLLTVQNVLTLLGAGLTLTKERLPWKIQWFNLEPLTLGSLACYVFAEMPESEDFPEKSEVRKLAFAHLGLTDAGTDTPLRTVGEVYSIIMDVLRDPAKIPDTAFNEDSYLMQASWDDWGRGYKPDPRPLDPDGNVEKISERAEVAAQFRPYVMIDRVATRTQAVQALERLSIQGEGMQGPEAEGEWSHFKRFKKVFIELQGIQHEPWQPTLPVPTNPTTVPNPHGSNAAGYIASDRARNWADLFNLRYRMLLTFLMHTFQVAPLARADEPNVRAMLMHKVFGEMYQLKTLAGILTQLPLRDDVDPGTPDHEVPRAGPPFELPANIRLPPRDVDCWCLHLDILGSVARTYEAILGCDPRPEDFAYVALLRNLDAQTKDWVERILSGLGATMRYSK